MNKSIEGSLAVSGGLDVGRRVDIKSSAVVRHNLRVEGYLDAPNVVGPVKGIFASEEKLRAAYPHPKAGWVAGVGTSIPVTLWAVNDDGEWEATEGELSVDVPMDELEELSERTTEAEEKITALETGLESEGTERTAADAALGERIDTVEAVNANQETAISYLREQNTTKGESIAAANGRIDELSERMSEAEANIEGMSEALDEEAASREQAETALSGRIGTLESITVNQGSAIDYLRGRDTAHGDSIDALSSRLDTDESNIEGLSEVVDELAAADAALDQRKLDKEAIVVLSESEYEALGDDVDPEKYYFITEDEE